jgi:hypothetical protein
MFLIVGLGPISLALSCVDEDCQEVRAASSLLAQADVERLWTIYRDICF